MRTLLAMLVGVAIGASALGLLWATTDGDITLRSFGIRHDDGRVEVGIQRQTDDGWTDLDPAEYRFLSADSEAGQRQYSSNVVMPIDTQAEIVARSYRASLHQSGVSIADTFREYFALTYDEEINTPSILCIVDPEDEGIVNLCHGIDEGYVGDVLILEPATVADAQSEIEDVFNAMKSGERGLVGGWFATSLEMVDAALRAELATEVRLPSTFWNELVDQHLSSPETLFCVISHGGAEPQGLQDLFWGLAGESAFALAGGLNLNLRSEAHHEIDAQIVALRECVEDGAGAIATTIPDAERIKPVVAEANEAGIPILSFNSGSEVAREVGTALHFGLDDRRAGELAGEAFNANEVTGNVLCILHEPRNIGLELRCDGFESTFEGTVERWYPTDQTSLPFNLLERIGEGGVDGVLSLSLNTSYSVWYILTLSDNDLPHAGFGFGLGTAQRVASGDMLFAVIDHPEIQAYAATALAHLIERFRIDPGAYFGGAAVEIEPLILGPNEAQRIIDSLAE